MLSFGTCQPGKRVSIYNASNPVTGRRQLQLPRTPMRNFPGLVEPASSKSTAVQRYRNEDIRQFSTIKLGCDVACQQRTQHPSQPSITLILHALNQPVHRKNIAIRGNDPLQCTRRSKAPRAYGGRTALSVPFSITISWICNRGGYLTLESADVTDAGVSSQPICVLQIDQLALAITAQVQARWRTGGTYSAVSANIQSRKNSLPYIPHPCGRNYQSQRVHYLLNRVHSLHLSGRADCEADQSVVFFTHENARLSLQCRNQSLYMTKIQQTISQCAALSLTVVRGASANGPIEIEVLPQRTCSRQRRCRSPFALQQLQSTSGS